MSMILVVMPTIPHHHHGNGIICMKDDIKENDCGCHHHGHHHHHPGDDPCCTNNCLTQNINAESARQQANFIAEFDWVPMVFLLVESTFKLITQPIDPDDYNDHVYRESLHGTFITRAAGLRAPPVSC
ncbi:hypothetical protein D0T60_10315 [Bacteroides sp. 224]|nr:DUF6769 family protein [Bacteroides sp. 224]NDV65634.1 hypothetical protein [Bacteroides sp. 224]